MGDISKLITSALPRNSLRVSPTAAKVPNTSASSVAPGAMIRLFFRARIQSAELKNSVYQRREKPCSGYTRKEPELKDSGTITSTGRIRNNSTRAQKIRRRSEERRVGKEG